MKESGYTGRILRVDLSSQSTAEQPTREYADRFLGGRGIGAKVYWDEVPSEANAFDDRNTLVFATGPLAGVPVVAGSRWQVCAKSPEANPQRFSYGNLGGTWGAELKFAGYDAVVIQGTSERPVYLLIHDGSSELRDASTYWGKGSVETRGALKSELGGSVRLLAIGPAGENRAVMANILADNDASGSGGLGAWVTSSRWIRLLVHIVGSSKAVRPFPAHGGARLDLPLSSGYRKCGLPYPRPP